MLTAAILAPLFSILTLGIFGRDSGPNALHYILTGNVVMTLMFGIMSNVQSHFNFMRTMGGLDFFATLPISKYALILAIVVGFLLLSLPAVIMTAGVGAFILKIPLSVSPLILLVIPVCAVPLAGIGAIIGIRGQNFQESGAINLVVTLILTSLGPVIIPPDKLPDWMMTVGRFSPATYAASALRQTLLGPMTAVLLTDLLALTIFGLISFWLVGRFLDWRQR
jgi:ABC-2 type transport system permease protein